MIQLRPLPHTGRQSGQKTRPSADGPCLAKTSAWTTSILPKALLASAMLLAGSGSMLSAGAARAAAYTCVPRTSAGPGGFVNLKFTGSGAIARGDTVSCADKTWTINDFNFGTNPSTGNSNTGDIDFEWVEIGAPAGGYSDDLFTTDLHFSPSLLGTGPTTAPTTGFFDYSLAINPSSGYHFDTIQLDTSVGVLVGSPGSTIVTKAVSGGPTLVSTNGVPAGPIFFNTPSPITVRDTWTLAPGDTLTNVKDSFTQAVPGPLPLLGAAAAFGWSRRLRSRVKPSVKAEA